MKHLTILLTASCYILLAYFVPRQDFGLFVSLWAVLFGAYYLLLKQDLTQKEVFYLGLGFRLLWLGAIPALSDDFYRFVWDGRLLAHGLNPYTILPSEFLNQPNFQQVIGDVGLYKHLNSPNYYTVYPPLNQAFFGLCAWLSGQNLFANVLILRVLILLGELLVFGCMAFHFQSKTTSQRHNNALFFTPQTSNIKHQASAYFLNPLIIIELCGNLHFEGLMLLFIILSILLITRRLYFWSAICLTSAISIKMLPLVFIPLIINKLNIKKGTSYALCVGLCVIIGALFFVDNMLITRISSSINLYFQHFEFNASIYYLLRSVGYFFYGYNLISTIGILLVISTFCLILWQSFKLKNQDFFVGFLLILSTYFAFSLVVHPWYVCTLVGLSAFTRFRFSIVWSGMVGLSYFAYSQQPVQENFYLIGLEYAVVYGFAIWELWFLENRNFGFS